MYVFVMCTHRFKSDSANAQADLNLHWAHISECAFSDIAIPVLSTFYDCKVVSVTAMSAFEQSDQNFH